jgi:SAM-dependent methyltransferase
VRIPRLQERRHRSTPPAPRPVNPFEERRQLAASRLRGHGLEIGALHRPLPVPDGTVVRYVDRLDVAGLREQYPELVGEPLVEVDILDDGERLDSVADGSQAFVIANHFLEHCEDPIGALGTLLRVTRPGGHVYLAVPDKRHTFDVRRPVTTIDHLRRDHTEGPAWSRAGHYEEYARLVDGIADEAAAREHARRLQERAYSIHFHVWTTADLLRFVLWAGDTFALPFELDLAVRNAEETILLLERT